MSNIEHCILSILKKNGEEMEIKAIGKVDSTDYSYPTNVRIEELDHKALTEEESEALETGKLEFRKQEIDDLLKDDDDEED